MTLPKSVLLAAAIAAIALPARADEEAEPECGVVKVVFRLDDARLTRAGVGWTHVEKRPFTDSVVLAAELVHADDARVEVRARFGSGSK